MIGMLQVNHPPQKFIHKNEERKYQHEETYKATKYLIYSKTINKGKFQTPHKV